MGKTRLQEIADIKKARKDKTKGKDVSKLTAKEKDELLITMAKMLGLL